MGLDTTHKTHDTDFKALNTRLNHKKHLCQRANKVEQWWCTPSIPALRRKRQADLCEFKASLVYKS